MEIKEPRIKEEAITPIEATSSSDSKLHVILTDITKNPFSAAPVQHTSIEVQPLMIRMFHGARSNFPSLSKLKSFDSGTASSVVIRFLMAKRFSSGASSVPSLAAEPEIRAIL